MEREKTGNGTPDISPLTPLEEKIVPFLGQTAIEGIQGGVDTIKSSTRKNDEFAAEGLEEEGLDNSYNCDSPYERSPSPSMSVAVDPVPKSRKRACRSIVPPVEESEAIKTEREKLTIKRERLQIDQMHSPSYSDVP